MNFRKKSAFTDAPVVFEREDLFLSTVNRHADRVRAAAETADMVQSVRRKAIQDTTFGILGIVALIGSVAYGLAQIL